MRRFGTLVSVFVLSALLLAVALALFALPPRGGLSKAPPPQSPGSMTTNSTSDHPNANQEPKVEFHSETVLVQVPVVVVDKDGKHVTGLTKDDFEVLENGKAQKIASFEEITVAKSAAVANAMPLNSFSNTPSIGADATNLVVVMLDTVNTPFLDQAYGRKQLIRYLASNLEPGQSFALVALTSRGLRVIQNPTRDSNALLRSLSRLQGELSAMGDSDIDLQARAFADSSENFAMTVSLPSPTVDSYVGLRDFALHGDMEIARVQQDRAIETTMLGFLGVAWALSGTTGRKSLIWATGGFPFYIDSPGAVPVHEAALYERTMKALNDAQIAVYPVDVRGLVNTMPGASSRGATGAAAMRQVAARNWLQGSTLDTLRDFAQMTGGQAFFNTNDIAGSFHRAAADSAAYYSLAYYLDTSNRNPGWRKLKVKVNRKGVEVRTRNGFFVTNATANPTLSTKVDLAFAAHSPFDSTGVPLLVQWTDAHPDPKLSDKNLPVPNAEAGAPKGADKKKVGFLLRVPGNGVSLESAATNRFDLDVIAYAFDNQETETPASFAKNFEGSLPQSQLAKFREKGFGFRHELDLAPGKYNVRFVVRDNISGRVGTLTAPVVVD